MGFLEVLALIGVVCWVILFLALSIGHPWIHIVLAVSVGYIVYRLLGGRKPIA